VLPWKSLNSTSSAPLPGSVARVSNRVSTRLWNPSAASALLRFGVFIDPMITGVVRSNEARLSACR
jgi:hypothetical protein